MLEAPTIVETPAQAIAVIPITAPRERIREVMGPGIQELLAGVLAQGITPAGPVFAHHLRIDPAVFDFEIGVPVSAPVLAVGRALPAERPALTVARAVYRGPYEGLGGAWQEFDAWIKAQKHESAPDLWETYAVGPESGGDPSTWQTIFERPLIALS